VTPATPQKLEAHGAGTPAAESFAICATELRRTFGDILAVDSVDLAIEPGAVFGLLGPDGAGKSTLIRMLATVLPPDSGEALILGDSVISASRRITPRIGYMSQRFSMYPDLTVTENLEFFGTLRGVPRADRITRAASLLESMGLSEFADRQAQWLSGGMKQKLMLAATLMHEPELLLLDEPTTGVDPVSRREFWRIIAGLHRRGKTVLVATPYMDEAERCTHAAFMDGGRILHTGTPLQIKSLVPGTLMEVSAADARAALAALCSLAGVSSAHLYGEVVRVLLLPEGPDQSQIRAFLAAQRVQVEDVRVVRVDMEAAFAYLAEQASSPRPAAANGGASA
jgi:ABC-2 type transport system ATP-binding protein